MPIPAPDLRSLMRWEFSCGKGSGNLHQSVKQNPTLENSNSTRFRVRIRSDFLFPLGANQGFGSGGCEKNMHLYITAKRVTISSSGGCFWEVMKVRGGPNRRFSYRSVLPSVLIVGVLLPFLFIRAAFLALDGTGKCSSTISKLSNLFPPPRKDSALRRFPFLLKLKSSPLTNAPIKKEKKKKNSTFYK